ncbi:MAG: hypothetical protein JNL82_37525 [Myxococcales bacterium]|nr:hypothetical protein [Myxococcales bacterium]
MPRLRLDVDGVAYDLDYSGHDRPLAARSADGEHLRLAPWRLGQHLAALGHAARVARGELGLDAAVYAAHVLGDADAVPRWGPLALWWAAGALVDAPPTDPFLRPRSADPLVDDPPAHPVLLPRSADALAAPSSTDPVLRPWSLLARAEAVAAARDPHTGSFAVGRFLARLVGDCVAPTSSPDPLALPLVHAAPLLAAACRACAPPELLPPPLADPALRRLTVQLCRLLGWTPTQVWRAPADEVDRLVALLAHTTTDPPRPSPASALAGRPGTHTLQFE